MPFFNVPLTKNRFIVDSVVLDLRSLTSEKLSEYIKKGNFKGEDRSPAHALIDTGATHCSITEDLAEQLRLKPIGRHTVGTAGNPLECNQYSILLGIPVAEILGTENVTDSKTGQQQIVSHGVQHFKLHPARVSSLPKQEQKRGFDVILGMDLLGKMIFQYAGNPANPTGTLTVGF